MLASGQTVVGRGFIATPGTSFENQGYVQGNAPGLIFQHLVTGAGSFGGIVTFDGGTSFGNSPTKTQVTGNVVFTQNNTATVEIGGLSPGTGYDQVQATGTITLAGALNVQMISIGNSYTPTVGNSFVLYSAAAITGTFSNVSLPTLAAGLAWKLDYSSTAVTLTIVPITPPTVTSAEINGSAAARQRSVVQSFRLAFSSVVNIAEGAIEIRAVEGVSILGAAAPSLNTIVPLRPLETSVVNGQTVVIVRFADTSGNQLSSLNDGKYRLKINGSLVTSSLNGQSLDGDADGIAGGNYTYRELDNTSQLVDTFFRLYGDQDGDRDVDSTDLLAFVRSNNKIEGQQGYLWFLDYNGDRIVNSSDLAEFNLRRNRISIRP